MERFQSNTGVRAVQLADLASMPRNAAKNTEWRAHFGQFTLSPSERSLTCNGIPCRLGGRAFDILVALVEHAGETIGKKELIARVWPNMIVEEGSLRFHIVAIRKTLGEGANRFIINTANKGYTFVARVERQELDAESPKAGTPSAQYMPALSTSVMGRDEEVNAIVALLKQRRLISIVGAGGIGKTTVSVAATQVASVYFDGDVHFIDLSSIGAAELVRAAVGRSVGLQNRLEDLSALEAHLGDRKALLVLDCCEHLVAEAAELAETIVRQCPRVHILATSREPLRAAGEFVFRLQPLAYPQEGEGLTSADALKYPAVKLFVDRATANAQHFSLNDNNASLASQLCRELGGIALAIELAAGRVEALGLEAITSHFDASVSLMWHGRRTAIARHQTLGATLDWSYNLLSDDEQSILRRLSVFAGSFTLEAAIEICCTDFEKAHAIDLIASLVMKSLITVDAGGPTLRYSMLDMTKSYCQRKLLESSGYSSVAARFSDYFSGWTQRLRVQSKIDMDEFGIELPNLRAAFDMQFAEAENPEECIRFAASLCPLLLQVSQVAECARWAQAAISHLPSSMVASQYELRLQGALGQSLTFVRGGSGGAAESSYQRAIALAKQLSEHGSTLHLLNGYAVLLHREGRYNDALAVSRQAQDLLSELSDVESHAIVESLMGVSLHLVGHVCDAMVHWLRCFSLTAQVTSESRSQLGFDYNIRAMCGLARSLWLTGKYARALKTAEDALDKSRSNGHAVTHCIALIWGGSVFAFAKQVDRMVSIVDELERIATSHALEPYLNVAQSLRGQILILQGSAAEGVERIRTSVVALRACRYEMVNSQSLIVMAQGLSDLSLHAASFAICDEAEHSIRSGGDLLRLPELLTTRGHNCIAVGQEETGIRFFREAIKLASEQGAKSEKVRAIVAFSRWQMHVGQREGAVHQLQQILLDAEDELSPDLVLARALLSACFQ